MTKQHLQELKAAEEARFFAEEKTCYGRFAVNDCLRKVRAAKRVVLDELRRQQVLLNDLERRKQGKDQLEQIQEKSATKKLEVGNVERLEAVKAYKEREAKAEKKAADQLLTPALGKGDKRESSNLAPSLSAAEAAKNKRAFELKVEEAQGHRQSREAELLKKKGEKPSLPLPAQ